MVPDDEGDADSMEALDETGHYELDAYDEDEAHGGEQYEADVELHHPTRLDDFDSIHLHDPDDPDVHGMGSGVHGRPTLASGPPPSRIEMVCTFLKSGGGLVPYLRSLSDAFGWRYVGNAF